MPGAVESDRDVTCSGTFWGNLLLIGCKMTQARLRNQTENHTKKSMRFWGVEARFGVYNSKIGFPITYETEESISFRVTTGHR